jgi:hypothetical protein
MHWHSSHRALLQGEMTSRQEEAIAQSSAEALAAEALAKMDSDGDGTIDKEWASQQV